MRLFAAILSLCILTTATAEDKKPAFDAKKLVGTWTYVSGMTSGEKAPKENLQGEVTITKETITVPAGPEEKFVFTYKIDASATPAKIDLKIKSGPVPEGTAIGIVEVKGNKMTLCYTPMPGGERPTEFKSTAKNGEFLFVLKKVKKNEK